MQAAHLQNLCKFNKISPRVRKKSKTATDDRKVKGLAYYCYFTFTQLCKSFVHAFNVYTKMMIPCLIKAFIKVAIIRLITRFPSCKKFNPKIVVRSRCQIGKFKVSKRPFMNNTKIKLFNEPFFTCFKVR